MQYRMLLSSLLLALASSLAIEVTARDLEPLPTAYRLDDSSSAVISLADHGMAMACNGTTLVAWIGELEVSGVRTRRIVGQWIGDEGPAGAPFSIVDDRFDRDAAVIPPRVFYLGSVFRVAWAQDGTLRWRDFQVSTLAPLLPVAVDLPPGQDGRQLGVGPGGEVAAIWSDEVSHQLTAQVFAADGTPVAASFPIAVGSASSIFALTAGQWLAVWEEAVSYADHITQVVGHSWWVKARRFDTAGMPLGGENVLFSGTRDQLPLLQGYENQGTSVAPLVGGEILGVHGRFGRSVYSGDDRGSVVAKTIAASDIASAEMEIQAPESYITMRPRVASEPSGEALVVWNSSLGNSFSARHLEADGTVSAAVSLPSEIGSHLTGTGTLDSVGQSAAVVWIESFAAPAVPTKGLFFRRLPFQTLLADGFESGNLIRWCGSSAAP